MKCVLLWLIRLYQRGISAYTRPKCRFEPTCSAYAAEAIERFGALRGSYLAICRLMRCRPGGGHGFDPVPEKWPKKRPESKKK